ncbi:MAG: phosphatase PAP2 family protein [Elusimicrobiota bacterium]
MNSYSDLSIILPTINEKENLKRLLNLLASKYKGAHIFIADDGSTDSTIDYINNLISRGFTNPLYFLDRKKNKIITNDKNYDIDSFYQNNLNIRNQKGLTASVLDTLAIIPTEKFCVIDADFQHPPEIIQKFHNKLEHSDLTVGYRKHYNNFPWYRKLLTAGGTFIARLSLPKSKRVKDPLSGAFGGNLNFLKNFIFKIENYRLEGFKILYDLLKLIPPHTQISQAGYVFNSREKGKSKIKFTHLLSFYKSVLDIRTRKMAMGFVTLFVVCVSGFILISIYGDMNLSSSLSSLGNKNTPIKILAQYLSDYGNFFYYILFAYFLIYGGLSKRKDLLKLGLIYLGAQLIASVLITRGLKIIIGRPRPGYGVAHEFFSTKYSFNSFPSGHATDAFCSAGVLWQSGQNYLISFLAFLYSFAIAISRVAAGAHYLLDVLSGIFIGFLVSVIFTFMYFKPDIQKRNSRI